MSLNDDVREAGFRQVERFLARNAFRMLPDPHLSGRWGREFTCHRGASADGVVVEVVAGRDEASARTRVTVSEAKPGQKGTPARWDLAVVAEIDLVDGVLTGSLGRPCLADSPRIRNEALLQIVRRLREESVRAQDGFFEHEEVIPFVGPRA